MGPENPLTPLTPIASTPDEVPDFQPVVIDLNPAQPTMPVIEFRPYDVVTFFRNAPEDIQDILIREAYLARAAEILVAQQEENQRIRERVDATRPPFMAFRKDAKAEFEAQLAKAEKEVEFFARALAQNESAMLNLRKAARRQLENSLGLPFELGVTGAVGKDRDAVGVADVKAIVDESHAECHVQAAHKYVARVRFAAFRHVAKQQDTAVGFAQRFHD